MKKTLIVLFCAFALSIACRPGDGHNHGAQNSPTVAANANNMLFAGAWCVDGDDMRIEFAGTDSVMFRSESDPSVNGNGTFSFDSTHLRARLSISGVDTRIVYRYTATNTGMTVVTELMEANGQAINSNPEPISLIRCR